MLNYSNEPLLRTPVLYTFGAIPFLVIAWKMRTNSDFEWFRLISLLIGLTLLAAALISGLDYLADRFALRVGQLRSEWYRPTIRYAEIVSGMNTAQLNLLSIGAPIRVKAARPREGVLMWKIVTPELDLDLEWVYDYLDRCAQSFPDFPPQHGWPDATERLRIRSFTKLVCNPDWGIADPPAGPKPARWKLPDIGAVRLALGLYDMPG